MSTPEPASGTPHLTDEELAYARSLFDAARQGETQYLRDALQAGVPVNLTNEKGDTLLNLAAYLEHEDTVAMLLEAGADTERVSSMGFTALICAVFRGNEAITRRLLEAGAGQATGHQHVQDVAEVFGQQHLLPLLRSFETRANDPDDDAPAPSVPPHPGQPGPHAAARSESDPNPGTTAP